MMESKIKAPTHRDMGASRSRRRKGHARPAPAQKAPPAPARAAPAEDEAAPRGFLEPELVESDGAAGDDIERC